MNLLYNAVVICLLMKANNCKRNFHMPHSYFHGLAMQHDSYQEYDSSNSESIMVRPHRKKYYRNRVDSEYSDVDHDYKLQCKCSCPKCKKPNPKACCMDFCAQQCDMQNNILVVPYPVPFIVHPLNTSTVPQSTSPTTSSTTTTSLTTSPTTTTTTKHTITTTDTPAPRKTIPDTMSTAPAYQYATRSNYKRFRIVQDNRRNMENMIRHAKFDSLPKYGIIPIPEKFAKTLMKHLRNNQNSDRLKRRLNL